MIEDLKRLDEYVPVAKSTESIVDMWVQKDGEEARKINSRFSHGADGLVTEVGEIEESILEAVVSGSEQLDFVNMIEECGDIIWYLAITVDSLGMKFEELDGPKCVDRWEIGISQMVISAAQILDKDKRTVFYGKLLETEKVEAELVKFVWALKVVSDWVVENLRVTNEDYRDSRTGIEVAIDKVTRKLTGDKGRYKDGFTQDEAYNRDLEQEREVLEK
jgi:NTP pyrophosphatase (non-canonical NTP hydrolase)